jgi:hypothetical protein
LLESALITFLLGAQIQSRTASVFHVERESVANGAELVTVFGRLHDAASTSQGLDVPMLTVLRDSLGDDDPATDRLRYVWILTSARPTPWQRAASALSFVYFRAGSPRRADRVPAPVLDLASPAKSVWSNVASNSLQSMRLDPMGMPIRSTTRSYRSNSTDYRKLQVFEALSTLDDLQRDGGNQDALPDADLRQIYSRLSLSNRTFGGLVQQRSLTTHFNQETSRLQESRGHNWELLRQRAELCGLFFEPLALPDGTPSEALLWVARDDLAQRQDRRFDGQFLGISNPWTDDRLLRWTGYTQVRYFDSDNRPVAGETPGARPVEMIPLAFYNLEHPRVPLLLADFRDSFKLKRRELIQLGVSSALSGVFGITRFGNWWYFAADALWTFVQSRHGAAVNRTARLEAYSEAREFLALDCSLDPALKADLFRRLDYLAINPLENDVAAEAYLARQQYAALLQYAGSPLGLPARLEQDRRKELDSYTRSRSVRLLARIGRVFRLGSQVQPEDSESRLRAGLAVQRSAAYQRRFLQQLLAASPRPEVVWDAEAIRRSIEALSSSPKPGDQTPHWIAEVFLRTSDESVRLACLRALQRLDSGPGGRAPNCSTCVAARNELVRLSQDSAAPAVASGE